MAFLFCAKGDVPANRPEIYRECATLMFEKWDQNRGIRADIPGDFDLIDLFSHLAARIYGRSELESGVSKHWLLESLTEYFAEQYIERNKAFLSARTVLEFVTGRAWVMSDIGAEIFSFTHRTFLEYFYSRYLEQGHETVRDLLKLLIPHIRKQEWDVVCHLSLQIKTFRNQPRTAQAVQILTHHLLGMRGGGRNVLPIALFAARSLEYLIPTEQNIAELVRLLLSLTILEASNGNEIALQCVRACCLVCNERREFTESIFRSALTERFAVMDGVSDISVATLVSRSLATDVFPVLRGLRKEGLALPVGGLIDNPKIRQLVSERATTSAFYAALRWHWYRELLPENFSSYGFGIFLEDPRVLSDGSAIYSLIEILVQGLHPHFLKNDEYRAKQARSALKVIARGYASSPKGGIIIRAAVLGERDWWPFLNSDMWTYYLRKAASYDVNVFLGSLAIYVFVCSVIQALDIEPKLFHGQREQESLGVIRQKTNDFIELTLRRHRFGDNAIAVAYRQWHAGITIFEFMVRKVVSRKDHNSPRLK